MNLISSINHGGLSLGKIFKSRPTYLAFTIYIGGKNL